MSKGGELVSQAILGKESKTVVVGGRPYFLKPPTIKQIAGVGHALSGFDGDSLSNVLSMMQDTDKAAEALSWFIAGDESMTEVFRDASLDEVVKALEDGLSMVGIEDFRRLSGLSKSVHRLIANPKS